MCKFKLLLSTSLLISGLAQADLLDALKHYDKKDYAKAQAEFAALLPLGNETAAFNLAVMHKQGQGVPVDLVKTQAYLQLAAQLGDMKSVALAQSLYDSFNPEQQQQAKASYQQLAAIVQIKTAKLHNEPEPQEQAMPDAISRKEPKFPRNAARSRTFGFADARFLIDEAGKVQGVEIVNEYPEGTFTKATKDALSAWEYQATGRKHIGRVSLSFSLGGVEMNKKAIERLLQEHKLFDYALAGSPGHQYLLGSLLRLVQTNSFAAIEQDSSQPFASDYSLPDALFTQDYLGSIDIPGFKGYAKVSTDEKGKVTAVHKSKPLSTAQAEALLVGKTLHRKATSADYQLNSRVNNATEVSISKVLPLSPYYHSDYWLLTAAKNGHLEAQRIMASRSEDWENYMLQNNDPAVQTWVAVNKILKGEQEQGRLLLEKAVAQHYEVAEEIKAAL